MGRGKRAGVARLGVVGREIALSDSGRDLRIPAQLVSSLTGDDPARFPDQTVRVYPEGSRSYVGSAVSIATGQAEALGRPRVCYGRAYIDGEDAVLTNAFDNEVARARVIDDRQLHLNGVGGAEGLLLGELVLEEDLRSVIVYDRWLARQGVVKVTSRESKPIDLRLAAVGAYFFLLAQ